MPQHQSAVELDQAVDEALGTRTPVLGALEDALYDRYSAESWGLGFLMD